MQNVDIITPIDIQTHNMGIILTYNNVAPCVMSLYSILRKRYFGNAILFEILKELLYSLAKAQFQTDAARFDIRHVRQAIVMRDWSNVLSSEIGFKM